MELPVQVTIYHLPGCTYSEAIRALVETSGVPCETVNVLTHPRAMHDLPLTVKAPFPTVRLGSRTILNATPAEVERALKKLSAPASPPSPPPSASPAPAQTPPAE